MYTWWNTYLYVATYAWHALSPYTPTHHTEARYVRMCTVCGIQPIMDLSQTHPQHSEKGKGYQFEGVPCVAVIEVEEAHVPCPVGIEQSQSEHSYQCCKEGPPQGLVREVVGCLQLSTIERRQGEGDRKRMRGGQGKEGKDD